ncbi:M23/M56 family metallopeptidase [Fulvivirgaceae bacterium BMA10]|uniref:M23/M56 family metallopeptidase n=1 Tax=Splendidivirga corallicola TaxID=3051826 RepID=A0ABT8KXM3_9BACT|nr:M23/M56 family metallopeptidase [Fulvivirgaceae bacterium BMA10]
MIYFLKYLVEASIGITLFYLLYRYLFKGNTFFQWNRCYLLLGILLSLIIPLFHVPIAFHEENSLMAQSLDIIEDFESQFLEENSVQSANIQHDTSLLNVFKGFSFSLSLILVYSIGVIYMFFRFLLKISSLLLLIRKSKKLKIRQYRIVYIEGSQMPFSFLHFIFLPKESALSKDEHHQILAHEQAHVDRKHSYDILLMEGLSIIFWFNPVIRFVKRGIMELHEFEADAITKSKFNTDDYANLLLKLASGSRSLKLVNHFSKIRIKSRIMMLKQRESLPLKKLRYLVVLPVLLLLISAFALKREDEIIIAKHLPDQFKFDISIYTETAQDKVPSILPLAENSIVRLSSGFGMRFHPIKKVKKMHLGIDLSAPVGTEIFATADGEVALIKNQDTGYGKQILLEHGDHYSTRYAQLNDFTVEMGDKVKKGDVIGYVGSSGTSTAPHLHYEVLKDGKRVDPEDYFESNQN